MSRRPADPGSEKDPFDDEVKQSAYYQSLFEALNWAYTLDDRLARELGEDSYDDLTDEEEIRDLAKSVRAFRYARNAVQHQWDEAVYLDQEKGKEASGRMLNIFWRWLPELQGDTRDPEGQAEYTERLAGEVVLTTLTGLMPVFSCALVPLAAREGGAE